MSEFSLIGFKCISKFNFKAQLRLNAAHDYD